MDKDLEWDERGQEDRVIVWMWEKDSLIFDQIPRIKVTLKRQDFLSFSNERFIRNSRFLAGKVWSVTTQEYLSIRYHTL